MMGKLLILLVLVPQLAVFGQDTVTLPAKHTDTTILIDQKKVTLPDVWVRNNFDYHTLLKQIREDTTFYKAFRNLRIIQFSSYNDIKMLDKKGAVQASLFSKTRQNRKDGCRTMDVLEQEVTGDMIFAGICTSCVCFKESSRANKEKIRLVAIPIKTASNGAGSKVGFLGKYLFKTKKESSEKKAMIMAPLEVWWLKFSILPKK